MFQICFMQIGSATERVGEWIRTNLIGDLNQMNCVPKKQAILPITCSSQYLQYCLSSNVCVHWAWTWPGICFGMWLWLMLSRNFEITPFTSFIYIFSNYISKGEQQCLRFTVRHFNMTHLHKVRFSFCGTFKTADYMVKEAAFWREDLQSDDTKIDLLGLNDLKVQCGQNKEGPLQNSST